jgi:hypothetical protein
MKYSTVGTTIPVEYDVTLELKVDGEEVNLNLSRQDVKRLLDSTLSMKPNRVNGRETLTLVVAITPSSVVLQIPENKKHDTTDPTKT